MYVYYICHSSLVRVSSAAKDQGIQAWVSEGPSLVYQFGALVWMIVPLGGIQLLVIVYSVPQQLLMHLLRLMDHIPDVWTSELMVNGFFKILLLAL